MIRVYVWLPVGANVGHVSAQIGQHDEPDAIYVSWWPAGAKDLDKRRTGRASSLSDDKLAEKSEPHKVRDIDGLCENDAAAWWEKFLSQDDPEYNLPKQNCAWAVVSVLKAGGADDHFPWYHLLKKYNVEGPLWFNTQRAIWKYVSKVQEVLNSEDNLKINWKGSLKKAITIATIDLADDLIPTWSPRDTLDFCDHLISGIQKEQGNLKLPPK